MDRYDDLEEYNWLVGEVIRHETEQAKSLGVLLWNTLRPSSVVDIGCSSGLYLLPFKERGCTVFGVDGASAAGKDLAPLNLRWWI